MKEFRVTFETEKLDVMGMCAIVRYAIELKCKISFSPMEIFMHIDCDCQVSYQLIRWQKELYGA